MSYHILPPENMKNNKHVTNKIYGCPLKKRADEEKNNCVRNVLIPRLILVNTNQESKEWLPRYLLHAVDAHIVMILQLQDHVRGVMILTEELCIPFAL